MTKEDREKVIQVFEGMKHGVFPWYSEIYFDTAIEALSKQETVTEFADRCRECGSMLAKRENCVLDKVKAEIREWYWQVDKQALAKDPCVVDAMISLFIRTIDKYKEEINE